jgi:hypothetical protein
MGTVPPAQLDTQRDVAEPADAGPNGMAQTEWTMRAVHELGFDIETALYVTVTVAGFVIGVAASLQMDTEAEQETGLTAEEWMEKQSTDFEDIVAGGRYPLLAALAARPGFDMNLDTVFELGLSLLLDGFARLVDNRVTTRPDHESFPNYACWCLQAPLRPEPAGLPGANPQLVQSVRPMDLRRGPLVR